MVLLPYVCLAGAQPLVVRAVLMAAISLLIRVSGHHSRPVSVLVLTLNGILLFRPAWALSIGFQLSAAATAGLTLMAPRLEQAVQACLPDRCQGLAAALSISAAALLWTLPLQLLHFGAILLEALLASLLVAPMLAPLTLLAMVSALLVLVVPAAVLPVLLWPVQSVGWAGDGHCHLDQPLAWSPTAHRTSTAVGCCAAGGGLVALDAGGRALPTALVAAPHGNRPTRALLGAVRRWTGGRGAFRSPLVVGPPSWSRCSSEHGDARSGRIAQRLAAAHGHARLAWVILLDPVATDVRHRWQVLAQRV